MGNMETVRPISAARNEERVTVPFVVLDNRVQLIKHYSTYWRPGHYPMEWRTKMDLRMWSKLMRMVL